MNNPRREEYIMSEGTVKWFNAEKGFGFITPDGGGPDLFGPPLGHPGSRVRTLLENQRVSFEVAQGQKGPQATNVVSCKRKFFGESQGRPDRGRPLFMLCHTFVIDPQSMPRYLGHRHLEGRSMSLGIVNWFSATKGFGFHNA